MDIAVALVSFFVLFGAWMILPSSPRPKAASAAHPKLDVAKRSAA
jgi:hypothetical protein